MKEGQLIATAAEVEAWPQGAALRQSTCSWPKARLLMKAAPPPMAALELGKALTQHAAWRQVRLRGGKSELWRATLAETPLSAPSCLSVQPKRMRKQGWWQNMRLACLERARLGWLNYHLSAEALAG